MANTFVQLTDTPSVYTGSTGKFVQVSGVDTLIFNDIELNTLTDVQASGAYEPSTGDILAFTASGNWRPTSNDPYSVSNGLNKSGSTLNVVAGTGGGLTSNTSGVYITGIANVSGTYGNTTHVPQITVNDKGQIVAVTEVEGVFTTADSLNAAYVGNISGTAGTINVTGGTGINSNATITLVATGVTAATYGNTTHAPQITVDTYGRITNVDLVEVSSNIVSGNGNVNYNQFATEAYRNIEITGTAGQTALAADLKEDTLTFNAGAGIEITTTASSDTITITAANVSINSIDGIDTSGAQDGQALIYDAGNAVFVPGNVATSGGGASVTVSDSAPSSPSNGDLWWRSDTGKLKIYYDDGTSQQWVDASPASGSTADYSTGALILPTSGTPSTEEGSVTWDGTADILYVGDGTSAVAISGAGGSYGNADVQTYLDAQGYSNVSYGNVEVQTYLDAQGYSNVDSDSQTLTWDAANVNLAISGGNNVTLFDQSLDSTDTVTFNQVNTEDVTGADQLILNAGASGITASTNGNMQFNATSGSIFLVSPTVDAQESAFLANTITANALTVNGQTITAYGNTEVQTYLDAQGYSNVDLDAQTLTWDSGNSNLSISGGNTVTLTGLGGGSSTGIYTIESSSAGGTGTGDVNVQAWIGCPAASTAVDKVWTVKHNTDDGYVYAIVSYTYPTAGAAPAIRRAGFGDFAGQTYSFFGSANNLTGCAAHGGAYFPVLLQSTETYASVDDIPTMGVDSEGYIQYLGPEYTFRGIDIGSNLATLPVALTDGVAIGDGADAGSQSVAIGLNAVASTNFTTAVGFNALATGAAGSAIGHECEATGPATVAMGSDCTATVLNAIAIGYKSDVTGTNSIAIGNDMDVSGTQTVAIAHNPGAYSVSNAVLVQAGGTTKFEVYPDVVNLTATNVSLTYDSTNAWVFGAAVSVGSENVLQSLTWDSGNSNLSISGGNTVTLTGVGGETYAIDETGRNNAGDWIQFVGVTSNQDQVFLKSRDTANTWRGTLGNGGFQFDGLTANQAFVMEDGANGVKLIGYHAETGGDEGLEIHGIGATVSNSTIRLITNGQESIKVTNGTFELPSIPTSDPSNANEVWADNGVLVISGSSLDNAVSALGYAQITGGTFSADSVETANVQPVAESTDSVDGNNLNIDGGDATGLNSTGGDVVINGGVGALANGDVSIGTTSTVAITIGATGTTNTINGETTFGGDARFDTGVEERFSTINAATGTVVHDCDNGHVFRHTAPSADWTANFTNLGLTTSYATTVTLVIDQGATARIPTAVQIGGAAQTLLWQGGSAPSGTANGEDVVSFSILRTGASTYTVLGQLVGFS